MSHSPDQWVAVPRFMAGGADIRVAGEFGPRELIATVYRKHDASLIKAAPAMLEALEELISFYREVDNHPLRVARAVVAYARGGE